MDQEFYNQLAYYTLGKGDGEFIHQILVDAFAASQFDENTKPVKITLALVGLYLVFEKGFSGREVQIVHMRLAKLNASNGWPEFEIPKDKPKVKIEDAAGAPDNKKDEEIKKWAKSVWETYRPQEDKIKTLLKEYLDIN